MFAVGVGGLPALTLSCDEDSAVAKTGFDLAAEDEYDVATAAPVVGGVAGRVFDHAKAEVSEFDDAPPGGAGFAGVLLAGEGVPVGLREGNVVDVHTSLRPGGRCAIRNR